MALRQIHITNAASRDATITLDTCLTEPTPRLGRPGQEIIFQRDLASTAEGLNAALMKKLGDTYAQALIDGDPEIDKEKVGRRLPPTSTVYLSSTGEVLHASPHLLELILEPDGSERERREPQDVPANVNEETPVRWTGRKVDKNEAAHKFVFRRTLQLKHTDGLTFDFLYAMAKELHEESVLVFLAAGAKGREPLVFQANGIPYRGFLEGRVDGERYQLLLRLSNLELKRPQEQGGA